MNKIYLDIDGCVNTIYGNSSTWEWDDFDAVQVKSYWITYSRKMMDALLAIDAEVVWATSWSEDANLVADAIGIDHLRYLPYDQYKDRDWNNCGKMPVIMADCGDDPFVWIDDCHGRGDYNWMTARKYEGLPCMGITPIESKGITPKHIQEIKEFFDGLKD